MIVEELALMCMAYGEDINSGKKRFEEDAKGKTELIAAVSKKINDLSERYNLFEANQSKATKDI